MADESNYLPAGVRIDPYAGNEPSLDPDLEKVRDEEVKALSDVKVEPRAEPTIDPELVKARDEQIARDKKRAKELGLEFNATASGDDNVSQEATSSEPKVAKKPTAKKS
jgi:hypothetical protein